MRSPTSSGIEPSPALRELERQILQQDPSLDPAPSGSAALWPRRGPPRDDVRPLSAASERARSGGGAEARDGALRRPRRRDGACLRPGSRADAGVARPLLRRDGGRDRGRGRHDREVRGRRRDGRLRRAGRARGPRRARASRGALDAAAARGALRRDARAAHRREHRRGGRRALARGQLVRDGRLRSMSPPVSSRPPTPARSSSGERTVAAVRGAFEFSDAGVGRGQGQARRGACRSLVRRADADAPARCGGLDVSFVGRGAELELLRATYRRAVDGAEPHLVTVVGDAGVGKTRLVARALALARRPGPREPLHAPGAACRTGRRRTGRWRRCSRSSSASSTATRRRPPAAPGRARRSSVSRFGLDAARDLHPLAARERLHEAWVEFLDGARDRAAGRRADRGPALGRGAAPRSARADRPRRARPAARARHRPTGAAGPTGRPGAAGAGTRRCSGSSRSSSEDASRAARAAAPAEGAGGLRELLVERAEGNPFFLEELVSASARRRRSRRGQRRIPDSVQAAARGAHRSAPTRREGRAPGRVGDRARRSGAAPVPRAARRRAAGLRRCSRTRLRPPALGSSIAR